MVEDTQLLDAVESRFQTGLKRRSCAVHILIPRGLSARELCSLKFAPKTKPAALATGFWIAYVLSNYG